MVKQIVLFFIFFVSIVQSSHSQINFSQSNLNFSQNFNVPGFITGMSFGPDGRLYVIEIDGSIKILTIQRNSATNYNVTNMEIIEDIFTIQDHNDDGSMYNRSERETTGIAVGGTATSPVFYVSSSDIRIGAGNAGNGDSGLDTGLDTNSGVITRYSWNGITWDAVDIVRGLPRSEESHMVSGLQLATIKGIHYLLGCSGGFTNGGAPSTNFVYSCEFALSAAVLAIDLDKLNQLPISNDNGRNYIYDLPTLDDPTRPNSNGIDDPDDIGYNGKDINDPFGGNDGLNMAIIVPDGPVQILSPGYRNAYGAIVTESGALYVTDNGANPGWGGFPENEGTGNVTNNYNPVQPGDTSASGGEYINNQDHLQLITTNLDTYQFNSFYGGHPNPLRANPQGAGLYTDNSSVLGVAGSPIWRTKIYDPDGSKPNSTTNPNEGLPANWPPVQVANPVEGDWRGPGIDNPDGPDDNPVTIWETNTNPIDEYTASNFGGVLKGNLLAGHSGGKIKRVIVSEDGTSSILQPNFLSGIGGYILGLVCNGDNEIFPGTVWAGTTGGRIVVLEPQENGLVCLQPDRIDYDPEADYDSDGYTNQDEIDNGTDICNGGSQPSNDFDKIVGPPYISDYNDPDDDADGIPDSEDPFQLGNPQQPLNQAFTIPVLNDLFNNPNYLGGIFGLGMTGLMNNGDTGLNWLNWLDRRDDPHDPNPNDVLGGAPGIMTSHMTSGTALGLSNNQEKGYQYGVRVDSDTDPFTVIGGMNGFSGGSYRLYGNTAANNGELGFFIGDGTQSNYIKFVVTVNGFTVLQEIEDIPQTPINVPLAVEDRPLNNIRFYFVVNPQTGEVKLEYRIDSNPRIPITTVTAQGAILNAIQSSNKDLAVGFIGTSGASGVELEGSWDFLNVISQKPSIISEIPDVDKFTGADPESLDLRPYFTDDQGSEDLTFSIVQNSNNSVGTVITNNALNLTFPETIPASSNITIRATDADDNFIEQSFTVNVSPTSKYFLLRLNAGGSEVTHEGLLFEADKNFTGGRSYDNNSASVPDLYKTERSSLSQVFGYNIPVPNGDYTIILHFAEIYWGVPGRGPGGLGRRIFDVTMEGQLVLDNYDIFAEVGAQTGVTKSYTVTVTDGVVNLSFSTLAAVGGVNQPKLSALEILGSAYTSENGTPVAVISATPLKGSAPLTVNFSSANSTDDVGITSYLWDFGDGSINETMANPTHIYDDPGTYTAVLTVTDAEGIQDTKNILIEVTPSVNNFVLRLNAGGSTINHNGILFEADKNFTGGSTYNNNSALVPNLYKTERSGLSKVFGYNLPVPNGDYTVILHFAELYWGVPGRGPGGSGRRIFDVTIEGQLLLDNYDIFAEVGAQTIATKSFAVTVVDGVLNLSFSALAAIGGIDQPKISALEILGSAYTPENTPPVAVISATSLNGSAPLTVNFSSANSTDDVGITSYLWDFGDGSISETTANPTHIYDDSGTYTAVLTVTDAEGLQDTKSIIIEVTPPAKDFVLRLNAGGPTITHNGILYEADKNFTGGSTYNNNSALVPDLYKTERSGLSKVFSYNLPVPNGDYTVILHFAELYWGVPGRGPGGSGRRIFDVTMEGVLVLDNYDIFAEVGAQTVVTKSYPVTVVDGVLNLSFSALASVGGVDQAKLSALEIIGLASNSIANKTVNSSETKFNGSIQSSDNLIDDFKVNTTKGIKLFPNPTNSDVHILYGTNDFEIDSIELFDINGRLMTKHKAIDITIGSGSLKFNITGLAEGVYLIVFKTNLGKSYSKNLIIRE
ncbi:malectin domain-containing carbohydrate-binding protein [Flavobacterium agrisoli]|uniref:PKD domain-containing protein n=1 Tax=Flavobacterium agrisoli TaxID=2793066 RepID=A0A934UK50_9FLAO|nr:malectin domain-containing carbohydrate-binding protein [Flavobacterium agrisoli]MBK0370095.1 PKD domain-containing protein [Flavobacterium agrisoli]